MTPTTRSVVFCELLFGAKALRHLGLGIFRPMDQRACLLFPRLLPSILGRACITKSDGSTGDPEACFRFELGRGNALAACLVGFENAHFTFEGAGMSEYNDIPTSQLK